MNPLRPTQVPDAAAPLTTGALSCKSETSLSSDREPKRLGGHRSLATESSEAGAGIALFLPSMAAGAVTMDTSPGDCRFRRRGNHWSIKTDLPSDITVQLGPNIFHLHKFPLLSRCSKIARIISQSPDAQKRTMHVDLAGCPGGLNAFILAAKFCYGLQVELTAKNILNVYRVAQHLGMTEDYGEDNLLAKAGYFFHKVILRSWKHCLVALRSISDDLETDGVLDKALCSVSVMACTDLSLLGWPMMMYGRQQSPGGSILWNGINSGATIRGDVSDWWFEDVSNLPLPLFSRLMEIMKQRGMRPDNVSGAIVFYARKHLPGLDRWLSGYATRSQQETSSVLAPVDQKVLIESIEKLLPETKAGKYMCQFLLGLLRIATILDVGVSCKHSLERRIGVQLEWASVEDLMIPSFSADSGSLYDTDCVERIIKHYLAVGDQSSSVQPFGSTLMMPVSASPTKVSLLVDSYLAEVASDEGIELEKMWSLTEAYPRSLRPLHDGLYRALDIYLKAHPWLQVNEKEQLLGVLDLSRLSLDACNHASQNERLPLRVTLQVLFFEQLRLKTALSSRAHGADGESNLTGNEEGGGGWVSLIRESRTMKVDMDEMRSRVKELENEFENMKQEVKRVIARPHGLPPPSKGHTLLGCMHLPHLGDPPKSLAIPQTNLQRRSGNVKILDSREILR